MRRFLRAILGVGSILAKLRCIEKTRAAPSLQVCPLPRESADESHLRKPGVVVPHPQASPPASPMFR